MTALGHIIDANTDHCPDAATIGWPGIHCAVNASGYQVVTGM